MLRLRPGRAQRQRQGLGLMCPARADGTLATLGSMRTQQGQVSAELVGMLLIVAVIVGALFGSGIGGQITCAVQDSISRIAGGDGVDCQGGGGGQPAEADASVDSDGDGVSDADERRAGTDPQLAVQGRG
jgi:hypothetical protein